MGYCLQAELRVLEVCRDVVDGGAVARSNNRARAALAQRSALTYCERHEIVDVSHDRITKLGNS